MRDKLDLVPFVRLFEKLQNYFWEDQNFELDGDRFHEMLIACGLAAFEEYDPDIHGEAHGFNWDAEKGDPICWMTPYAQEVIKELKS